MQSRPWPSRQDCLDALRQGDGSGARIAILDTGVDGSHRDMEGVRLLSTWGFRCDESGIVENEIPATDPTGHGTAIASIINRIAPRAEIVSIRVLDAESRRHRHEVIRQGAFLAARLGVSILNCSFGVPGTAATIFSYMGWSDEMLRSGKTVVGACSNDSEEMPEWPSHLASAIGVTAGNCHPEEIHFRSGRTIPFAAAGVGIDVPAPGGGRRLVTGSSFAAAHVTGLLARLHSSFPGLSPALAREALVHLSSPSKD